MLPFTIEELEKEIAAGYVTRRKHKAGKYSILNYSSQSQYDSNWNPVTLNCRGLIIDEDNNIVARGFPKFFNYGEKPNDPIVYSDFCVATEKADGCFTFNTKLNLWDGGTIKIGEVVSKELTPILIGRDSLGNLVPTQVTGWHNNGTKDNWLDVEVDCPVSLKSGAGGHRNIIRITSNHEVVANDAWVTAGDLKGGDAMVTYEKVLDSNAMHVIKSGLLGDGCISPVHNAYRYQESHSTNQHDYVDKVIGWLGSSDLKERFTTSGYGSEMKWANSHNLKSLETTRQEWYPNGIKVIPEDLSWVDDFSIAKWYMDDGSLSSSLTQKDRAVLSTNAFQKKDVDRLAFLLSERYAVNAVVHDNKGWCIRINAGRQGEIDGFWRAIAPHVVPSLRYKLPLEYRAVPYQERSDGSVVNSPKECIVLGVEEPELTKGNFPFGRVGFDITTTTGNYLAKGVLVHNSLGVIYPAHFAGHKVATRGSFHSEQAEWASNWLFRKYGYKFKQPEGVTTLVEIIYKDNRIVLDYGDFEGLVLLGAIDNTTGADIPIWDIDWWEGERVKVYTDIKTAEAGCKLATSSEFSNQEGLVMTWYKPNQPSYRLKIKHQEYIRLHGVIHNFSKKRVWEALAEKQDFLAMLDDVPDEFYDMVHSVVEDLKGQYAAIEKEAVYDYRGISKISDRKQFALRAQDSKYKAILFMMLDGKDYSKAIWKIIEPRGDE